MIITTFKYSRGLQGPLTGILLALAASWALANYFFETSFHPDLVPVLILGIIVCALTVITGLVNSFGLLNRPPLEVLRQEV
jgi:putative ABC transport system permease protein